NLPAQPARDEDGLDEGRPERHLRRLTIRHEELPRTLASGANERPVKRLCIALALLKGPGLQLLHGDTDLGCRRRRRHRTAKAHGDAVRNLARQLPQETSAFEAEDAPPYAVQVHGDDGHVNALHNSFQAVTERKQLSGACDLAFREDA